MRKEQLVELINTKYPQIPNQVLEFWIGRAWNQLLYDSYKQDPASLDFFATTYYAIAVSEDSYGSYYSTLPVSVAQLPDNADGVRRISTEEADDLRFMPVPRDSFAVFGELEVNLIDNGVGYCTTFNKVLYESNPGVSKVKMDVVPNFESYDDKDEINVPNGWDMKLIQLVEFLINGTPPENKVNA